MVHILTPILREMVSVGFSLSFIFLFTVGLCYYDNPIHQNNIMSQLLCSKISHLVNLFPLIFNNRAYSWINVLIEPHMYL